MKESSEEFDACGAPPANTKNTKSVFISLIFQKDNCLDMSSFVVCNNKNGIDSGKLES